MRPGLDESDRDENASAFARHGFDVDLASVIANDAVSDRQPEAGCAGFGARRIEGFEKAVEVLASVAMVRIRRATLAGPDQYIGNRP